MPKHDENLRTLQTRLWEAVQSRAPLSRDASDYLEQLSVWSAKTPRVISEAQKLINAGDTGGAQALVDEHNEARPRRKPGRPRTAGPSQHKVFRALHEQLVQIGLHKVTEDPELQKTTIDVLLRELLPYDA